MFARPYRFLIAAAVLAAILCLFPVRVDAPDAPENVRTAHGGPAVSDTARPEEPQGLPAGADLSERTAAGCMLHRTLYYAPCGHSVQRREALPAPLVGMSRTLLEREIGGMIPGAAVTGFSASEVDISVSADIPCPLHWVLRGGEDGQLGVWQNRNGEALEPVRETDVPLTQAPQEEQAQLLEGRIFDNVQALEGYLESLSS